MEHEDILFTKARHNILIVWLHGYVLSFLLCYMIHFLTAGPKETLLITTEHIEI